jgi:hypothetical protein
MNITLRQFQQYAEIEEPTQVDMIRCFLNKPLGEIDRMKATDFTEQIELITEALDKESIFTPTFKLEGVEYGFIPNLDNISYGENRDMVDYVGEWATMHKAAAVCYRPIKQKLKDKYLIEDYKGTAETCEIMRDMPLDIVQGMNVFFYNLTNDLLNSIPKFIRTQLESQGGAQALEQSGGDIKKFIHSLKAILPNSMQ